MPAFDTDMRPGLLAAAIVPLALAATAARGEDDMQWQDVRERMETQKAVPSGAFSIPGTTFHGSLVPTQKPWSPAPGTRSVGVKVQPIGEMPLSVGFGLSRSQAPDARAQSSVDWGYAWTTGLPSGWLDFGLATAGSYGLLQRGASQNLSGHVRLPLLAEPGWIGLDLQVRPEVSYDLYANTWGTAVTPAIQSRAVLRDPARPFGTTLDLSLGYRLEPNARPGFSAGFAIKVTLPGGA